MSSKNPYKLSIGFFRMRYITDIPHGYVMGKLYLRKGNFNLENKFIRFIMY